VKALAPEYAVSDLCATLGVVRSAYYAWLKRRPGPQAKANARLQPQIQQLFTRHRGNYGSPRICAALRQQGVACNVKRVARLMRADGLQARQPRRYRVRTTDSQHDGPIAPNLLPAKVVSAPDQAWVVDITYIPTGEGWLYLAGVLDRHSRRLVGWAMAEHLETSLPLSALQMACHHRQPPPGLLHHSDRGVQYASTEYRQFLTDHGLVPSMSRKGNCYDNATMESFWGTLKQELVTQENYATRAQARQSLFAWIETYYNRVRLHSALGYQSPVDFENQLN
jgi:putative transposase